MPLNVMCRRARSGVAVSKIQDRIAGSSARRSPAGANQTKQGVSLGYADIRIFIHNDLRAGIS